MKRLIFIVLLICLLQALYARTNSTSTHTYRYWEDYSELEKRAVLESENTSKTAIKFYYNQFNLSDNEASFRLMKELTSPQTDADLNAFYFHLFNKIVLSSDGAVSEELPQYMLSRILSSPCYVLNYFISNRQLMASYAHLLGVEFHFKESDTSDLPYTFNQFKQKIAEDIKYCPNQFEDILSAFYKKIQKQMEEMDQ